MHLDMVFWDKSRVAKIDPMTDTSKGLTTVKGL